MGENLNYWSRPFFAIYQNTTRLQATGANLSNWSHQWFGNVWKYNKIAGNSAICKLLKPPIIWPCVKIQQDSRQATNNCASVKIQRDCRQRGKIEVTEATIGKYNKIAGNGRKLKLLKPPRVKIQQDSKQQQDCRQRGKFSVIEATNDLAMFQNATRLQAMRGTFQLLMPPAILHCLRPQQDCRQQGKISVVEATNDLAMSENTTRLPATGRYVNYWSHQLSGHVWKYNKIPGKPPIIVQVWKYNEIAGNGGKLKLLKPPLGNTTRLQAMGGTFRLLTPPNILFETTTRLQATGENFQ